LIVNDDAHPDEVFEIEPTDSGSVFAHLPWWLILTVAVVVTELTAHPAVGVSVLCLKFGWNDFRTSIWLRRRDLIPRRRDVCSLFYFASGMWRVCLWSFGLMFVAIMFVVAVEGRGVPPPKGPDPGRVMQPEVLACMGMWMMSFVAATLITILSVVLAWYRNVKVWISGSISDSRRRDEWPPRSRSRLSPESNLLKWWLIGSGAGLFVALFLFGMILLFSGLEAMNRQVRNGNNQGAAAVFGGLVGGGLPIISAVLILAIGGRIFERIGAQSATECWPDEGVLAASNPSG